MTNCDTLNTSKDNLYKLPSADSAPIEKSKQDRLIITINQSSTGNPSYRHQEESSAMPYSTESKLLPNKESIDTMMVALTTEEKEEFFHELLHASMKVVLSGKPEYVEALRQLIVAWEYTAEIAANPELARDIDNTREEIENDQSSGIDWRELLRG